MMNELIVDSFAGGGGASLGIEMALGRSPDVAINHDAEAIALHAANHATTRHYREDVWKVDPLEATGGKPVGLMWLSPDCKHFSKAKGGKPVSKRVRGLAWVAVRWAAAVKPRVLSLENVEEFQTWGRVGADGRPVRAEAGATFEVFVAVLSGGIARVKADIIRRFGKRAFWHAVLEARECVPEVSGLRLWRGLGYDVQWKELRACDFGAPTIRKRLFLVARCDGKPIVWPKPTHGKHHSQPWRTAAECIDWSIPCPSIFTRKKALAENTLKRIAAGIRRYVIETGRPFIVRYRGAPEGSVVSIDEPMPTVTANSYVKRPGGAAPLAVATPFMVSYYGAKRPGDDRTADLADSLPTQPTENRFGLVLPFLTEHANSSNQRNMAADEPLRTQCAGVKGGHFGLVAPFIAPLTHHGSDRGQQVAVPLATVTGAHRGEQALVSAFLAKHYSERNPDDVNAAPLFDPAPTVTSVDHSALVASTLVSMRGTADSQLIGRPVDAPLNTISSGGIHAAEVRAFLVAYYGNEKDGGSLFDAMRTVTSKERFGLVTVDGHEYQIADIGMRMLAPRELYRAQGFPDTYRIDVEFNGKPMTKTAQVRMCGNSVCPPVAAAIVRANVGELATVERAA